MASLAWLALAIGAMTPAMATQTVTYYATNAQGTVVATMDSQGNPTYTAAYRPYGKQAQGAPQAGPGYTGHVNDPDSGLVYMQQRYYDAEIGRFPSPDPIGPTPGNIYSFNRYVYADDNPLRYIDPTGMCSAHQTEHIDKDDSASEKLCARIARTRRGDAGGVAPGVFIDPSYMASTVVLHHIVIVTFGKALSGTQKSAVMAKLNAATGDIDKHSHEFTAYQKKKFLNIKNLLIRTSGSNGVYYRTNTLELTTSYVLNPNSTPAWLASVIGHDGYHVFQLGQLNEIYNRSSAPGLEKEANRFQSVVGRILELTPLQINWIRTDTHTAYNDVH